MIFSVTMKRIFQASQFVLLLGIFGLLLWSQPWDNDSYSSEMKTISVTGETVIEATPDEFTFYPYFRAEGTDKDELRDQLVADANASVEALKNLGLSDEQIELDASSYDNWYWDDGDTC